MNDAALFAKQYLEDILSFFGLRVDVSFAIEDEYIQLDIPSTHLNGFLIGKSSQTLKALHILTSSAVQQYKKQPYKLNIDVAGYKRHKAERLTRQIGFWIKEVKEKGSSKQLNPMGAAERRLVHQLANAQGLQTKSFGQGDQRHVVLEPVTES
ncbi:MAG: single-stranded DNA-binding protein [Candidatus Saccharibacteria bacterium]|nr:single-stranded DNA-binding protein [Candidatus Saccharibacteria bacterium]